MAEVLPPPMQSSSTITMLHSRPSSADAFQGSQQYHQPSRLNQAPRSMYNGQHHGYRTASAPVQPYAFQSTPHLRQESRTTSTPNLSNGQISGHRSTASTSTSSSDVSLLPQVKDEPSKAPRVASMIDFGPPLSDLSFTSFEPNAKASPDRYRRPAQKRVDSISNGNVARTPSPAVSEASLESASNLVQPPQVQRQISLDDISAPASKSSSSELAKRYRRRSLNQLEEISKMETTASQASAGASQPLGEAQSSNTTPVPPTTRSVTLSAGAGEGASVSKSTKPDSNSESLAEMNKPVTAAATQKVNPPPRGSSEPSKRLAATSPLSRQADEADSPPPTATGSPLKPKTYAAALQSTAPVLSPAAQQLAAVSDKDLNKGMKSRLRRAFSFSSAQELRKAAGENSHQTAQQAREQHQQQIDDEMDAEQLEIARRQEAAGIGAGIYSGQGGFTGSTDNLSISSTASSASMMLRKMGRGAKKSARSIKGLFRPKSVIGVPAADGPIQANSAAPVEPSIGQVSMVTVEAERQNVNVNAHPDERTGGGTGFPRLERNSLDAAAAAVAVEARGSVETSDSQSRRSIVGSDKDRAEVLAAVRKGILKRSVSGSPSGSPVVKPSDNGLPHVPYITESPTSSIPGTPREGPPGRSSSAPAVNDYFASRMTMARSMPNTPNGSVRSISFSPRIQFHDAWSSSDYDRRGEIATCNRLTPLLAQQIKEELNTFKMEMEVHELSKPHTHFF